MYLHIDICVIYTHIYSILMSTNTCLPCNQSIDRGPYYYQYGVPTCQIPGPDHQSDPYLYIEIGVTIPNISM